MADRPYIDVRGHKHRLVVKRTSRRWECHCTCGYYQGNHQKDDAVRQRNEHCKQVDEFWKEQNGPS